MCGEVNGTWMERGLNSNNSQRSSQVSGQCAFGFIPCYCSPIISYKNRITLH